jgi:3-phosphoshikimate 1-carboxyvinyltransferase
MIAEQVNVHGPCPLRGRLRMPGDKSLSHRALMLAGVASGTSRIRNLANGDDVHRSRLAMEALGVRVREAVGELLVTGSGFDGLREPDSIVDIGNSGTGIRLLTGLLAGRPFLTVLVGDASIARRPMGRVAEPLRAMGARIDGRSEGTLTPLVIRGGGLRGTHHHLAVASAQVKSAILLAGLQAAGTTLVTEPARSRDHTERMLEALGVPVTVDVERRAVTVQAAGFSGFEFTVPGDPSSAAFWVVGALVTPGSELTIEGVNLNPGRIGFVEVLRRMGAVIEVVPTGTELGEPVGDLHVVSGPLQATVMEGEEIPSIIDEIPILAVAAAFAEGTTEVHDAAELRLKETDRIGAIEQELGQLGARVRMRRDGLSIDGGLPMRPGTIRSHGDHRIAMAAAIAANAIDGVTTIRGWRGVASSYPTFTDDLAALTGAR